MAYSDKSWQAAFTIAEKNLKKEGKQIRKVARKMWGNDLMVGAIGYQFCQGFVQGYNNTLEAMKAQAEAEAEAAPEAEVQEEAEAAQPSEENSEEE